MTQLESEGKPEVVETMKFNNYEKTIPTWIDEAVKKDNRAHVADQQVFNPLFFSFASQLLKYCTADLLDLDD